MSAALLLALALRLALASAAAPPHHVDAGLRKTPARWVATWAASPQAPAAWSPAWRGLRNRTVREVMLSSVGGSWVRVRVSNAYGSHPLRIGQAAIGLQSGGAGVLPGTSRTLLFGGRESAVIPPGGQILSDPVKLMVPALRTLAVSLFLPGPTGPLTEHTDAEQVNYIAAGDRVGQPARRAFREQTTTAWYLLSGVEVAATPRTLGSVVALGDSITDGVGSRPGANARWPNDLARRLHALPGRALGVVDAGIGGNRVLQSSAIYGVDALARFKRDVLDQAGVRAVIILEGLNDIGFSRSLSPLTFPHATASATQLIAAYRQLIAEAHAAGVKVFGGTLTPFQGAKYWSPAGEAERETINRWIRQSHAFDGVIDFARAVADRSNPRALNPAYDSGDHLHLNDAGYRAMAGAIDLRLLILGLSR